MSSISQSDFNILNNVRDIFSHWLVEYIGLENGYMSLLLENNIISLTVNLNNEDEDIYKLSLALPDNSIKEFYFEEIPFNFVDNNVEEICSTFDFLVI